MADPKRVTLESPKPLKNKKTLPEDAPTLRFELRLGEQVSEYSEYSYAELVKEARVSERESKQIGSDDPFSLDDDDQKLQEIARKFEEKYNPKPIKKKKKKLTISEDYIDKGLGYDETDPFIDNEEAYDELVPSTLTTQFGGFYINKGDLEFRNLSESENGFDSKLKKKRFKHGIDREKKKRRLGFEENQKRRGRRPLNENSSALKCKKKTQPTVADMLQQHKANLQRMQQVGTQQMEVNPIEIERDMENEIENIEEDSDLPLEPAQASTISEAIESVIKASAEEGSNGSVGPITGSSDEEIFKIPVENVDGPKLPGNLPPDLDDVLVKLKEAAYRSEEGKCKFFSDEVNRMLLSVELKAQALSSAQRSIIYSHLASHLPCTKETLQKRAKKLRLDQEDGKLREPMQKLKDGIAAVMPSLIEKYNVLLQASNARGDKRNGPLNGTDGEESQEEGDKQVSREPKKRFEWNDFIRKSLCDVVRIKLKCYEVSKTRIQSAEEYLKHFLEAEVKHLWPEGWMQSRILFRESRAAHFYITNRPKKQLLVNKKPVSLSSTSTVKPPGPLFTNTIVPQETEFDQIFQDKNVPLIPSIENVLEKHENLDLLRGSPLMSAEERVAEFAKLFTLPIKSNTPDDFSISKNSDNYGSQLTTHKLASDVHSSAVAVSSNSSKPVMSKTDKLSKSAYQNKQSSYSSKPDYNTTTEGSLASDMLSRIICASLADFPYAGSRNCDNTGKTLPVSSNQTSKELGAINSKFSSEALCPKKSDSIKQFNKDNRLTNQEFSNIGINIESFLNPKNQSNTRVGDPVSKNKIIPESLSLNSRLKESIVPHSRQFAEAFERTADVPLLKKHKGQNVHSQVSSSSSISASSRQINMNEHINDYPSSTSPRASIENAQKVAFDIAKYSAAVTSQGNIATPYKKRTKYGVGSKVTDQWTQFFEGNLGPPQLEGMKGFPFPVSSLPTPPPAHSSSPHRTSHSQHNSPRPASHISPGLRSLHESKSDSTNHNAQIHSNISSPDIQRRQSFIQGPWQANPSQTQSTSLSHFISRASPPISNSKAPSPNNPTSNSVINMSPVPAHSSNQIDKLSYSVSSLPLRANAVHVSLPQSSKPSHAYSYSGLTSYTTPQVIHTVSSTLQQSSHGHNNVFDSPSVTPSSNTPTSFLSLSPELKTANPRTN